jgi:hypothetical protein
MRQENDGPILSLCANWRRARPKNKPCENLENFSKFWFGILAILWANDKGNEQFQAD